jgi:hypothetical protein
MKDNIFFSNNSYEENDEEEDNNSLFHMNSNNIFQNQDTCNYFNGLSQLNDDGDDQACNNNEYNIGDYDNYNFENSCKSGLFPENENNLNKDFSLISPIPGSEDDYKLMNKNKNNNEISKEEILCKDINTSGSGLGTDCTPVSTGGTGSKSQSKENSLNNSNINNNLFNSNVVSFNNEHINNNNLDKKLNIDNIVNKNKEKTVLSKKRKQRIHLEDLNIDPEIIKYKKYQTIGDKVITSKNSVITDLDKKEIRAIRNRISAQKSRDRKKAEFLNLQLKIKYLQEQLEKQNSLIQNYEQVSCTICKSKINEIKAKFLENNNNFNIPFEQAYIQNDKEKEYLVLDENSSALTGKKSSIIGKISGALIALVCLVGIVLCIIEGGLNISNINYNNDISIKNNDNKLTLRQLESSDNLYENENDTSTNNIIKDEDININKNVPLPIQQSSFENNLNRLQIYHDRFGLEIYSFLKKKKMGKLGFLRKHQFYNGSMRDNSMCLETKNIEHNNYIIDNSFKNTLPVEANNIIVDNDISHKIISLFVKDYDTLKRFINGKSLSLQEQIENEAKNSEDGCVYLQMIIPKYKIDNNYGNNETYTALENDFFEIRCKIFAYNNYYNNKVTTF